MALFECASFITDIVLTITNAVCGLFCAPVYEDIKATIEAIRDPRSLNDDASQLQELLDKIYTMNPSEKTNEWIKKANETIDQFVQLRQQEGGSSNHYDDRQSRCLCSCGDACFRCNLHRKIKNLIHQGETINAPIFGRTSVEPIDGVPNIEDGTTADRHLNQVMDMLKDDNVSCIGVYGPVGVGKSTLVKTLNNKLAESESSFGLVKFIELQANDGDSEVQKAIAKSLKLNMGEGTEGQEAIDKRLKDEIHNTLQRKKFLLILDNVWKSINLPSIGIPVERKKKGSKIILTTQFRVVCTRMDAKEIEVEYLKEEEAWQLFAEKVGRDVVNDKVIEQLAKEVCKQCCYLPLALVVVGSAMKRQRNIHLWKNAVNDLQKSVRMDADIVSKAVNPLKLSYDLLDDTLKACFLYCSLYPKGYRIEINELVQCWQAENLINQQSYYTNAFNEGLGLIDRLKESCLLEGVGGSDELVRMNDIVQDVARWIGESDKRSLVLSGYGESFSKNVELEENVTNFQWISLVDNREIELRDCKKDYCSVTTLLVRRTRGSRHESNEIKKYLKVPTEFLKGFPAVKVLNLEGVESFDASLLKLEELHALILRDCSDIKGLPTADNLKVLDLSTSSGLRNISGGMKKFSYLKVLNLFRTNGLERIEDDTIRSLSQLEVLDMKGSDYRWPVRKRSESREATLKDLSGLQRLREAYLELAETDGTYEECSWMSRLEYFFFSYHVSYGDSAISFMGQSKGKIFDIDMDSGDTGVGSFILHAEEVRFHSRNNIVKEIFANFSSTDQSNSKLQRLSITSRGGLITSSNESTTAEKNVPKQVVNVSIRGSGLFGRFSSLVFSNLEELSVKRWAGGFSNLASALGADFSKLKRLELFVVFSVFSSDDLKIVLPELKEISLNSCIGKVIFDCGPTQIQAIAPNFRTLEISGSRSSKSLCNCEPNEEWPSLKILKVKGCPELKKLPFMPSIEEISGEQNWWNQTEWDSDKPRSHMNQRFKPL